MKKILIIIWLVFVLGSSALACNDCDRYWQKKYDHMKYEQKYRFRYEKREINQRGRMSLIRAKYHRKRDRRYYRRRKYYRGYPSICVMRAYSY